MSEFNTVSIYQVSASATNPRKHFDEKAMEDLRASIAANGIINPILVRPDADGFEIVAGERRFKAALAVGLEEIPVIVRDLTDAQALEIQVIENLQRSDVHPLDEAEGYANLKAINSYNEQTIADKIGKSIVYVYQRIQLLNLIDSMKKMFWDGRMTVTHAIQIARLSEEMQKKVEKWFSELSSYDRTPSSKRLNEFIKSDVFIDLNSAPWKKDDADLFPKAGACSLCAKRTGHNAALFNDIEESDSCLDRKCFKKKKELYIQRATEEATEKGVDLLRVSSQSYSTKAGGALGWNDYTTISKKDAKKEGAREAIVIDGPEAGKSIFIKPNKEAPTKEANQKDVERAKEKAEKEKRRLDVERAFRVALLEKVIAKVGAKLATADLRDICAAFYDVNGWDMEHELGIEHKEEGSRATINDELMRARTLVPKTEFEINKVLLRLALYTRVEVSQWSSPDLTPLLDAAKRYKVDEKKMRAEVAAAYDAENPVTRKEEPTPRKAKKTAKGK